MNKITAGLRYFSFWAGWRKPHLSDLNYPVGRCQLFDPPDYYRHHWNDLCHQFAVDGLKMRPPAYDDVVWYSASYIPKRFAEYMYNPPVKLPENWRVWGFACLWDKPPAIVLLRDHLEHHTVIRHEMTHLIGPAFHSDPHFHQKYGNIL